MSRKETTRITVEIPKIDHKRLKTFAALQGKSMKEVFIEFIENGLEECHECLEYREPNEVTKKAIEESFKKTRTRRAKTVKELFEKLAK